MIISEVRITLRDEEKLKAFANVTFDNCFVVRGMKVIQGTAGYFVSMPSRKREDGTHSDIAHPTCMEMRQKLEEAVLKAYTSDLMAVQQGFNGNRSEGGVVNNGEPVLWPGRLKHSG